MDLHLAVLIFSKDVSINGLSLLVILSLPLVHINPSSLGLLFEVLSLLVMLPPVTVECFQLFLLQPRLLKRQDPLRVAVIDFLQPLHGPVTLLLSGTEEPTLNLVHLSRQLPVFFLSELDDLLPVQLRVFREALLGLLVESHSAGRRRHHSVFLGAGLRRAVGLSEVHRIHLRIASAVGAPADVEIFADGQQRTHVTTGILDLLAALVSDEHLSGACSVDVQLLQASRLRLLHLLLEAGARLDHVFPHYTFDVVLCPVSLLLSDFSLLIVVNSLALAFLVHDLLPV